jgi:hypothetical protein
MYDVPHDGGRLPAYRFGAPSKGTAVVFGGFDSYVEEFFPMMLAIAAAGYQVIGSRGPARARPRARRAASRGQPGGTGTDHHHLGRLGTVNRFPGVVHDEVDVDAVGAHRPCATAKSVWAGGRSSSDTDLIPRVLLVLTTGCSWVAAPE